MTRQECYEYWKNPDSQNNPIGYLEPIQRSEFLYERIKNVVKPDDSILELGCNVGRNLNYLWNNGYHELSGVDINKETLDI